MPALKILKELCDSKSQIQVKFNKLNECSLCNQPMGNQQQNQIKPQLCDHMMHISCFKQTILQFFPDFDEKNLVQFECQYRNKQTGQQCKHYLSNSFQTTIQFIKSVFGPSEFDNLKNLIFLQKHQEQQFQEQFDRQKIQEKLLFSCENCQRQCDLTKESRELTCGHKYCEDCLSHLIIQQIDSFVEKIFCQNCGFFIQPDIYNSLEKVTEKLKRPFSKTVDIYQGISKQHIQKIEEKLQELKIKADPKIQRGQTITISGYPLNVNKMKLQIDQEMKILKLNLAQIQIKEEFPDYWAPQKNTNYLLVDLQPESQEYQDIKQKFELTSQNNPVRMIKRIQNQSLYRKFIQETHLMVFEKNQNNIQMDQKGNETLLWHGTQHPDSIIQGLSEGFDISYARQGSWGVALYLADSAITSIGFSKQTKQILLCRVSLGLVFESPGNNALRIPPKYNNTNIHYDTIKGQYGVGCAYMIYNQSVRRAYPEYQVFY